MSSQKSTVWAFALPLSLVFLASAYYIKVPAFRGFVDGKTPLAKEYLGRFVKAPEVQEIDGEKKTARVDAPADPMKETGSPVEASSTAPVRKVIPQWPQIAKDSSLWPKTVAITQNVEFPAVVNGKKVGSLVAPPGTEVSVYKIENEKVAVLYKGGAAWLSVEQTDLIARAQRQ